MKWLEISVALVALVGLPAGAIWYVDDEIELAATQTKVERRIELTELEIRDKEYQLELIMERAQAGRALPTDPRRQNQLERDLERLYKRLEALKLLS